MPAALREVAGLGPRPLERSPVRLWVSSAGIVEQRDAFAEVGRQLVRATSHHVPILQHGRGQTRQPAVTLAASGDDHVGQSGMQREVDHLPAGGGDPAVPVDGAELGEQHPSFLERSSRRSVEPWQRVGVADPPGGEFQGQAGQVDLGDLGLPVGSSRALFELGPQAIGRPRLGPPGTTGPLFSRCPRR